MVFQILILCNFTTQKIGSKEWARSGNFSGQQWSYLEVIFAALEMPKQDAFPSCGCLVSVLQIPFLKLQILPY